MLLERYRQDQHGPCEDDITIRERTNLSRVILLALLLSAAMACSFDADCGSTDDSAPLDARRARVSAVSGTLATF